jgi:hypothetical protein
MTQLFGKSQPIRYQDVLKGRHHILDAMQDRRKLTELTPASAITLVDTSVDLKSGFLFWDDGDGCL